jgi:hypothetical protein
MEWRTMAILAATHIATLLLSLAVARWGIAFRFAVLYGAIPDIVWGGQWLASRLLPIAPPGGAPVPSW